MKNRLKFTIAEGIEIQSKQLLKWKKLLKPSVYKMLDDHCKKQNLNPFIKSGYEVLRGSDLSNFIENLK